MRLVTTVVIGLAVGLVAAAPAVAAAPGWTAHTIPGTSWPSNTYSTSAIACGEGGFCVEIHSGQFPDQISELRYGRVQQTIEAPLPSGGTTSAAAYLNDVACASATSCVAVGSYRPDAGGIQQPLVETYDGATWTPTVVGADPSANTSFEEVACNVDHCLAVSSEGSPSFPGLFLRTNGPWTYQPVTFPAPIDSFTASYSGVACAPTGNCYVSMSAYDESTGDPTAYFAYPSGSGYRAVRSAVPAGVDPATASPGPMSCAGAATCTVLAQYRKASGELALFAETFHAGTLTAAKIATPIPYGQSHAAPAAYIDCPAPAHCVAAVEFRPSAGSNTLLAWRQNGVWHTRLAPRAPQAGPFRAPSGVACVRVDVCTVAGSNSAPPGGSSTGIVWTYSDGSWSVTVPQRDGGSAYTNSFLDDVACSGPVCYASGAAQVSASADKPLVAVGPRPPTS